MRKLFIFIFTISIGSIGYSQTPDTSLTKKNVNKLFKTDFNYVCCVDQNPVWSICFNGENEYTTADTIQLFSDKYHYLKGNCCTVVEWNFNKKNTISISKTKVCQEPPMTTLSFDDSNIKIKLKKDDTELNLLLFKDGKLIDKFNLIAIDKDVMYNKKNGFRLTMIRQKI